MEIGSVITNSLYSNKIALSLWVTQDLSQKIIFKTEPFVKTYLLYIFIKD